MKDDVPEEVKKRRLQEIISTFYSLVGERNKRLVGTHQLVLVEGVSVCSILSGRIVWCQLFSRYTSRNSLLVVSPVFLLSSLPMHFISCLSSPSLSCLLSQTSKRSDSELAGRTDGNVKVIFPRTVQEAKTGQTTMFKPGDYVTVKVIVLVRMLTVVLFVYLCHDSWICLLCLFTCVVVVGFVYLCRGSWICLLFVYLCRGSWICLLCLFTCNCVITYSNFITIYSIVIVMVLGFVYYSVFLLVFTDYRVSRWFSEIKRSSTRPHLHTAVQSVLTLTVVSPLTQVTLYICIQWNLSNPDTLGTE